MTQALESSNSHGSAGDQRDHDHDDGQHFPGTTAAGGDPSPVAALTSLAPANEVAPAASVLVPLPVATRSLTVVQAITPEQQGEAPEVHPQRCVLPAGWTFEGDIETGKDLTVSGVIKGSILLPSADATLHICETGAVQGQASGGNVKIDGRFSGEIDATGACVELGRTSSAKGKILYSEVRMNGGRHELQDFRYVEKADQSA